MPLAARMHCLICPLRITFVDTNDAVWILRESNASASVQAAAAVRAMCSNDIVDSSPITGQLWSPDPLRIALVSAVERFYLTRRCSGTARLSMLARGR